jgi:hypothetical protein
MNQNEQLQKREELPLDVIKDQFPALSRDLLNIVSELSKKETIWLPLALVGAGALLLIVAVCMRIPGGFLPVDITTTEFVTMIIASASLMLGGAIFKIYQFGNWRQIITEHQALGMQVLNKEIDIAKDAINRKNRRNWGEIFIFQTKIRK